jgi:hypothetical protein
MNKILGAASLPFVLATFIAERRLDTEAFGKMNISVSELHVKINGDGEMTDQ